MTLISRAAIAAVLAISGTTLAVPALAQTAQAGAEAQAPAAAPRKLSKEGLKAIAELQKVVNAKDAATYPAALAAAEAAGKNADDRYVVAQLRLNQAINMNDEPGKIAAIQAMIASGGARPEDMNNLYTNLGGLSYNAKQYDAAATAFEKLIELNPNATDGLWKLAELRAEQKRNADAVALVERAIAANKAGGKPVPENWYKRGLQFAYEGNLAPQSTKLARDLVSVSPTADNWRNALLIYRQGQDLDAETQLDVMRLMRSAKALTKESDIYSLASLLDRGNFPAEAVAVVNEGSASGKIKASAPNFADILKRATAKVAEDKAALPGLEGRARSEASGRLAVRLADGYYGHGNYSKAAELYRLGLQKGSVDANLANTRLGIALALAGQKAEAETAFNAVTGPRKDLASFWTLWLSQSR
jgi:tetratricopeptide (TPR) repeat protein